MSQHLNLLSRRIAADAFEASKGDPAKTVAAVEKDSRLEGATKDEIGYVKTRVKLWAAHWVKSKIESPTAAAENPDLSFEVEPETKPTGKTDAAGTEK